MGKGLHATSTSPPHRFHPLCDCPSQRRQLAPTAAEPVVADASKPVSHRHINPGGIK